MRLHLPSFCDVTSRSDRICPVEPGRHSVEETRRWRRCCAACETVNKQLNAALTEGDSVYFGSLRVRQVFVHLLEDLLLHLRDGHSSAPSRGWCPAPRPGPAPAASAGRTQKTLLVYELTKPVLIKQCPHKVAVCVYIWSHLWKKDV